MNSFMVLLLLLLSTSSTLAGSSCYRKFIKIELEYEKSLNKIKELKSSIDELYQKLSKIKKPTPPKKPKIKKQNTPSGIFGILSMLFFRAQPIEIDAEDLKIYNTARKGYEQQVEEHSAKKKKLESSIRSLEQELAKLNKTPVQSMAEKIKKQYSIDESLRGYAKELSYYFSIQNFDLTQTVSFLSGNSQSATLSEAETIETAQSFLVKGYNVIYDADTIHALALSKVLGARGLGISGKQSINKELYSGKVIKITNAFLRMQVFGSTHQSLITPDSYCGLAQAVNNNINIRFLGEADTEFLTQLNSWKNSLDDTGDNLGIQFSGFNQYNPKKLKKVFSTKNIQTEVSSSLRKKTIKQLKEIEIYMQEMLLAKNQISSKGVVYFGSSRYATQHIPLTYNASRMTARRGIRATTGGAGGMMHVANEATFLAGGNSVGVPIGGRNLLAAEKRAFSEVHTTTISTSGYKTRIPILMHQNPLVVLVPGGRGTMKELAVTLMMMEHDDSMRVVFLADEYYDGLHEWLNNSEIPLNSIESIRSISNERIFSGFVKSMIKSDSFTVLPVKKDEKIISFNAAGLTLYGSPK